jgi:hypothetical protein
MPTAEQKFAGQMLDAKEDHNRWWAKRLAFEDAGWPTALDQELLRERIRELEQVRSDAFDTAAGSGAAGRMEAEREFWRQDSMASGPLMNKVAPEKENKCTGFVLMILT